MGDEPIAVMGVKREGDWRLALPPWRPNLLVARGGSMTEQLPHLDTLLIDADEARVELVWRLKVSIGRRAPRLDTVLVIDQGEEDLDALAGHMP